MFETFDNTPTTYIPNNSFSPPPEIEFEVKIDNLHELCCCDDIIGYYWEYGEDITIPITNCIPIEIGEDDITSSVSGYAPNELTEAPIGARCYNLIDSKSWKLIGKTDEKYLWQEDPYLTFYAPNVVKVKVVPDMTNKSLVARFYNHRHEEVYVQKFIEQNSGDVKIPLDVSHDVFLKGVYTMCVFVESDTQLEKIKTYEVHVR